MLIVCSNCEAKIRVPEGAAGKKGKCPKCGTVITIVPPADVPPSAEPESAYAAEVPPPVPAAPPPLPKASHRADNDYDDEPPRERDYDDEREPRRSRYDDDRDDDLSIRRHRSGQQSTGMSITSMILGIAGLVVTLASIVLSLFFTTVTLGCCCFLLGGYAGFAVSGILGILAVIFGLIGFKQGGHGFAWTGVITGGVNLLLILAYVLLTLFLGAAFFAVIGANQPPPRGGPFPGPGRF